MEAMAASGQPLPGSSAAAANRSGPTSMSQTPATQGIIVTISVSLSYDKDLSSYINACSSWC